MLNNSTIINMVKGIIIENTEELYYNNDEMCQKSIEWTELEFQNMTIDECFDKYQQIIDEFAQMCDDCGEWCLKDELTDTGYQMICEECLENNYFVCELCGEYVNNEEMTIINNNRHNDTMHVCEYCKDTNSDIFYCEYHGQMEYDEHNYPISVENYGEICQNGYEDSGEFAYCDNCEHVYHIDDMRCTDCYIFCTDCYEEQGFDIISDYHNSDFTFMTLNDKEEQIGIGFELETEFDIDYMDYAKEIHEDCQNIHLEHDCSLNNGFEIITNPMTYNYFNEQFTTEIDKIVDICENGYNYQHNSAGFHVHTTKIDNWQTAKLMFLVEYFKEELTIMAKRDERQLKRWAPFYTNGIEKAEFDIEMFDKFYEMVENDNESRYQALNITNYHTNEFRIFKGGMDALEIKARVELCHNFAQYSMNMPINISNMPSFIEVATYCDNNYVTDYLHREFEGFCQKMGI